MRTREVRKLLKDYAHVVLTVEEEKLEVRRYGFIYRAKVLFVDGSILHINEVWIDGELKKYRYYWLDPDDKLIIGWDNAPHHKKVEGFPDHKHLGAKHTIEPSLEHNLKDILLTIANAIFG